MNLNRKGFTVVEVIVAIAVLTVMISVFFPLIGWLSAKTKYVEYDNQASTILQEGIEVSYDVLLNDWDESFVKYGENIPFHPLVAMDKWSLAVGSDTGIEARYSRNITLSKVCRNLNTGKWVEGTTGCTGEWVWDKNSKLVKVNVGWQEKGNDKEVNAQLLITRL